MDLTIIVLKCKEYCAYHIGFDYTPNTIYLCDVGWYQRPVTYLKVKVGFDEINAP